MSIVNATLRPDGVAHLELNRPEVRNAINLEMIQALHTQLDAWASDDAVKCVVLSGAGGKAFAGGADISELRERTHREGFWGVNQTLFSKLEDFPRPTIAAIDGYALGGGHELALACDLRVGSKSAKVGLPEVTLGIYPAAGGTWRLPRLVGRGRAKELVFTGRIVDAVEANGWGLFERFVETDAPRSSSRKRSRTTIPSRCRWRRSPSTPWPARKARSRSSGWGRRCCSILPRSVCG